MGILNRIGNDEPRSLRSINPDVPAWLEQVVVKLLYKSPGDRYQSACEVAALLQKWHAHLQRPDLAKPLIEPMTLAAGSAKKPMLAASGDGPRIPKRLIGLAAIAFFALAGTVIYLETGKGTIRIETNSQSAVPVIIRRGDAVVKELTVTKAGASTRLKAGRYVIEVESNDTALTIKGDQIELSRGATWIARIERPQQTGHYARQPHSDSVNQSSGDAGADAYLVWQTSDTVHLNGWFAKTLQISDEQLQSINELLTRTWRKYIEAERAHTKYTKTPEGHLEGVVSDFTETRSKLETEFWDQLVMLVDGRAEDSLHARSIEHGDNQGDG
ncbi:hypothetical protein [Novipirellula rosea]